MIEVLTDPQIFVGQNAGGISRLFTELYRQFESDVNDVDMTVSGFWFGDNLYANACGMPQWKLLTNRNFRGKTRLQKSIAKIQTVYALKNRRVDIFHPTYYDPYFIPHLEKRPFVLTVHDMIHELYAEEFFPEDRITSRNKLLLAEQATRIIAVSQATKRDLSQLFKIDESRIDVVYHGASVRPQQTSSFRPREARTEILYVGQRGAYKNFEVLVRATGLIAAKIPTVHVRCIGGGAFSEAERSLFRSFELSGRFSQEFVSEDELYQAYRRAGVFVFPSRCEGFGIPLLEAFSCGCPVIASDIPVFREVAGDAAVYFDPSLHERLAELLLKILSDKDFAGQLTLNGYQQSAHFSWERCATETAEVYRKALA